MHYDLCIYYLTILSLSQPQVHFMLVPGSVTGTAAAAPVAGGAPSRSPTRGIARHSRALLIAKDAAVPENAHTPGARQPRAAGAGAHADCSWHPEVQPEPTGRVPVVGNVAYGTTRHRPACRVGYRRHSRYRRAALMASVHVVDYGI